MPGVAVGGPTGAGEEVGASVHSLRRAPVVARTCPSVGSATDLRSRFVSTPVDPGQLEKVLEHVSGLERFDTSGFEQHHAEEYATCVEEAAADATEFWADRARDLIDWF